MKSLLAINAIMLAAIFMLLWYGGKARDYMRFQNHVGTTTFAAEQPVKGTEVILYITGKDAQALAPVPGWEYKVERWIDGTRVIKATKE